MNRRSFLSVSSAAAAGGLIATTLKGQTTPPKKGSYTPVDPAVFHAAGTANSLATANLIRGNATTQDFRNAGAALGVLHTNWVASGLDSTIATMSNRVNEGDLTIAKMGTIPTWITHNLQVYNASITQPQVVSYISDVINHSVIDGIDYKTVALNNMHAGKTSQMISDGIAYLNAVVIPAPKLNATTHQYKPQIYYPPTGGGGSGADPGGCGEADLGALALTIAVLTLTVMTDGLDLLAAAAWEGIVYWGGIGVASGDVVTHVVC